MSAGALSPLIRKSELQRMKDSVQIGDSLIVQTLKSSESRQGGGGATSKCVTLKGIVVAKYQHLAVVKLPNGILDSVTWVELATQSRERGRKGRR